jgi:pyruvate formate-lyase/glycerol dehydratase family glycyl radical enzyme
MLSAKPEVCIERALHITRFFHKEENNPHNGQIKYAEGVAVFLSEKQPFFFDDNLLAGTTTSRYFGAPVFPELTGMTIWPELDTIGTRQKNPMKLSSADAEILDLEIFPFWMDRNILELTRKRNNNPHCIKLADRLIYYLAGKAGCVSHTVPDFRTALREGVDFIIKEATEKETQLRKKPRLTQSDRQSIDFYISVRTALSGIIAYAQNLKEKALEMAGTEKNKWRRKNLLTMASVCDRVPTRGARTFREAVNSIWLLMVAIHAENINMAISPGRLDQLLYPFYRKDMENGTLTVKEAIELTGCLWLKMNDNTNIVPESAVELFGGSGTVPAVTIGGVDENGEDAVNDMTYIMLRVTELLCTRDPNLNARYNYQKNSVEYRNRVAAVIASTKAVPAMHNDITDIDTLVNQGVSLQHSRDFAIIGCVELASGGRSYDASSSILLNLPAVLELALYNGKRPVNGNEQIGPRTGDTSKFSSFNQFLNAFERQFKWLAGQAIKMNEMLGKTHQKVFPTPLLSALFEGPLQKGKDLIFGGALYNSSGATHIGFADTVDSLSAIEKGIFTDRKITLEELLRAIKDDFEGHPKLHAYLTNHAPKFGTGDPVAQKNAQWLVHLLYDFYQSHINYRGGTYRPAYWTMTNHAGQGKLCAALPNGRKAHQPFASGITPVSQIRNDLASCLKSVASLDSLCIPGGEALNLKFPSINGNQDICRLGDTVESYFRLGGLQIQFNIASYEVLVDAKKNPEKYPGLLVRVSGYSAYFNDLSDSMKDEIITRTAYNLRNGENIRVNGYPALIPLKKPAIFI